MTFQSVLKTTSFAGAAVLAAGFFTVSSLPFSGQAEAAPRQPNYRAYCARAYPGSSANRLRTTGEYICTRRSRLQMRHYRVNLAQACQLTTGNPTYRNFGRGYVLCNERRVATPNPRLNPRPAAGPRSAGGAFRAPNLRAYCARQHPGSFLNRLRTTGEYICTQRTRLQMRHYRINLARACMLTWRTPSFRYVGSRGNPQCIIRRRVVTPGPRPGPRPAGFVMRAPNLRAYCARRHPGSFVNRLRTTGEYICTQRTRIQMRHYRINMAQACMISWRTTSFRYVGGRGNPQCVVRRA
jgi:hypothetical protein